MILLQQLNQKFSFGVCSVLKEKFVAFISVDKQLSNTFCVLGFVVNRKQVGLVVFVEN